VILITRCAKAILSGLNKRTEESFLIHLTGTGCISDEREQTWEGKCNPHVWDDVKEINEIYDLPDTAQHHVIDQWITDANPEPEMSLDCQWSNSGRIYQVGQTITVSVSRYCIRNPLID